MTAQPGRVFLVDARGGGEVADDLAGAGLHPACGSYCGPRWFCALLRHEAHPPAHDPRPIWQRVVDTLGRRGFGAFVPSVAVERRHARRRTVRQVPLFGPRYAFVRFDRCDEPGWRNAWHTDGVQRIVGGERPEPLPAGVVEAMLAEGWAKPITRDLAPALMAAGAEVRITDGPMVDQAGVCLWDDGTRVRVLLSLLGRKVPATLGRELVAAR